MLCLSVKTVLLLAPKIDLPLHIRQSIKFAKIDGKSEKASKVLRLLAAYDQERKVLNISILRR